MYPLIMSKEEVARVYHIYNCNTDLYVANHESVDLIYEDQVRDISSILNEPCQDFVQFRSLSLD